MFSAVHPDVHPLYTRMEGCRTPVCTKRVDPDGERIIKRYIVQLLTIFGDLREYKGPIKGTARIKEITSNLLVVIRILQEVITETLTNGAQLSA